MTNLAPMSSPDSETAMPPLPRKGIAIDWLFGVVLPAIALGLELGTGICSDAFVDPLPSWSAVVGVAAIPVLWAMALLREARGLELARAHRWLLMATTGFAGAYVVCLHELMFAGLFMLFGLGFGLVPLSPVGVAAIGALRFRSWLRRDGGRALSLASALLALLAGFAIGAAPFAKHALVAHAFNRAASNDTARAASGIRLLRWAGPQAAAEACERNGSTTLRIEDRNFTPTTFFKAFGVPLQEVLDAFDETRTRGMRGFEREDFRWDANLGGTQVGAPRRNLQLSDNRMDIRIDDVAGIAQMEWEFTWHNTSQWRAEESRMILHLPGGGAATRLTLWVAGEPQEAAFGSRSRVRAAYQEVAVRQQRDPALLTTCGPDRLLLQCFPVPANGSLKVRVGLTLPVTPVEGGDPHVQFPVIEAVNFQVAETTTVPLWIENAEGAVIEVAGEATTGTSVSVPWKSVRTSAASVRLPGMRMPSPGLTADEREPGIVVRQATATTPQIERMVLVVDGSAPMKDRLEEIASALAGSTASFSIWWAGEPEDHAAGLAGKDAASWLRRHQPLGGQDPAEVLAKAWDEASALKAPLVWLHGSLPLTWSGSGALRQRLERRPDAVAVHTVAVAPGENLLLAEFDAFAGNLASWNGLDSGGVSRALKAIASGGSVRVWQRETATTLPGEVVVRKADPAVRLWLAEHLRTLRSASERQAMVALAARLGVVSPYTGAVVLERTADYDRNALTQQDPSAVPQVPEPAQVALIAGVAALAFVALRKLRGPRERSIAASIR